MESVYDKIIIGAGLYGMYAALHCAKRENGFLSWNMMMRPLKGRLILISKSAYGIPLSAEFVYGNEIGRIF